MQVQNQYQNQNRNQSVSNHSGMGGMGGMGSFDFGTGNIGSTQSNYNQNKN